MKINSLNNFRAIAIVFILAGHLFDPLGIELDGYLDVVIVNFIAGGTFLFVFISGFLFHHVFYPKYNYFNFIKGKVFNVFFPYLFLGLIPIILLISKQSNNFNGYFLPTGDGYILEYVVPFFKYYISGRFFTAYWYIPFIMITFLLSPIHMKFINMEKKFQIVTIITLTLIALFVHRPIYGIQVLQSVLYFSPVYLIGIMTSIYKNEVYCKLEGKEIYIIFVVILLIFYQSYTGHVGNYHKNTFDYDGIDLIFIQKLFMCFFFFIFLHRFENFNDKIVDLIAATSFTSFFIHPCILAFLSVISPDIFKFNSWLLYLISIIILLSMCVFIAKFTKLILPQHSRFITGY